MAAIFREFTLDVAADSTLEVRLSILFAHPPQVQTPSIKWKDAALHGNTDGAKALDSVQRVRNNLFHGGKHAPYSPAGRDTELVEASLTLLYALLEHNERIRMGYETVLF